MKMVFATCSALLFLLPALLPAHAAEDVTGSVVKIYCVYNPPDYYDPWQMQGQRSRHGSGCVIDGNRILTNAHVVSDQTFLQVKRAGQAKKYTARLEVVAHECDLAVLSVEDKTFFAGVIPFSFGDLPKVRDQIGVYGFPEGGDEMCITEGIVSRIEHRWYTHSNAYLLACQIDAAINSGSSGGPVLKEGRLIGVAFQAGGGDNIGYMVPVPIIRHFLKDIEDGSYQGIPDLAIDTQEMESPALRGRYGMTEEQTGVLVSRLFPGSPSKGILRVGDVILAIDGRDVANNATVEFRKGERTCFYYHAQEKHLNDTITMKILREKKVLDVRVKLTMATNRWRSVPHQQYDVTPTYYIVGGLVFEPLTSNFLEAWGPDWTDIAPVNLVDYYFDAVSKDGREQLVVLVKVLADELNVGYHDWKHEVICSVNGRDIRGMKDLIQTIEQSKEKYIILVTDDGGRIVLEREKTAARGPEILKRYRIRSDRSKDLKEK